MIFVIAFILILLLFWAITGVGKMLDNSTRGSFRKRVETGPCEWCHAPDHGKEFHYPRAHQEGYW